MCLTCLLEVCCCADACFVFGDCSSIAYLRLLSAGRIFVVLRICVCCLCMFWWVLMDVFNVFAWCVLLCWCLHMWLRLLVLSPRLLSEFAAVFNNWVCDYALLALSSWINLCLCSPGGLPLRSTFVHERFLTTQLRAWRHIAFGLDLIFSTLAACHSVALPQTRPLRQFGLIILALGWFWMMGGGSEHIK